MNRTIKCKTEHTDKVFTVRCNIYFVDYIIIVIYNNSDTCDILPSM